MCCSVFIPRTCTGKESGICILKHNPTNVTDMDFCYFESIQNAYACL